MLDPQQTAAFARDGFLNIGPVMSESDVDELSDELDRILEIGPDGFADGEPQPVSFRDLNNAEYYRDKSAGDNEKPVWQIIDMWVVSDAFKRLISNPVIVKAISQLTGFDDLQVWHDQIQHKPADFGGATRWHQDAPLWPSIEPDTPVSAWIPFDDADIENGCMWMVPGSHRWGVCQDHLDTKGQLRELEDFQAVGEGFVPPGDAPVQEVKAVPRPVKRGEIHFHHSLTWHGSPNNHSSRQRRAIAIHFMTPDARYTGQSHLMQEFIQVEVGGPMAEAGPMFPMVAKNGEPVLVP